MTAGKRVVVVDYGMGNLRSVSQALSAVAHTTRHTVQISDDPKVIERADRLVLPGQGAMRDCMACLHATDLTQVVLESAKNKPLLGICVGMQMLFDHSEEGGEDGTDGLGVVSGQVRRFRLEGQIQPDGSRYKVPQMGWNQVIPKVHSDQGHPMWDGIAAGSYFYFVHSYYVQPAMLEDVSANTCYGENFASAIARGFVFATQFHPEKSADIGLRLFANFLRWQP